MENKRGDTALAKFRGVWGGFVESNSEMVASCQLQVVLCGGQWTRVKCWQDTWCGDAPLCVSFFLYLLLLCQSRLR